MGLYLIIEEQFYLNWRNYQSYHTKDVTTSSFNLQPRCCYNSPVIFNYFRLVNLTYQTPCWATATHSLDRC